LTEERSISKYLRKQNESLLTRLNELTEEKKRLDQRIDFLENRGRE